MPESENTTDKLKWITRQRLQYIEMMAYYTGVISRSDDTAARHSGAMALVCGLGMRALVERVLGVPPAWWHLQTGPQHCTQRAPAQRMAT